MTPDPAKTDDPAVVTKDTGAEQPLPPEPLEPLPSGPWTRSEWVTLAIVGGLLLISVFLLTQLVLKSHQPDMKARIVANADLGAFTKINANDVQLNGKPDKQNNPDPAQFVGHFLRVKVKKAAEVRTEMLAPPAAESLLENAAVVSLTASPTLTLGNQLHSGDLIELVVINAAVKGASTPPPTKLPSYMALVLDVVVKKQLTVEGKPPSSEPNVITLAVREDQRDAVLVAIASSSVSVTRKLSP